MPSSSLARSSIASSPDFRLTTSACNAWLRSARILFRTCWASIWLFRRQRLNTLALPSHSGYCSRIRMVSNAYRMVRTRRSLTLYNRKQKQLIVCIKLLASETRPFLGRLQHRQVPLQYEAAGCIWPPGQNVTTSRFLSGPPTSPPQYRQ